jgi:hypothetical protein
VVLCDASAARQLGVLRRNRINPIQKHDFSLNREAGYRNILWISTPEGQNTCPLS